MSYLLKVINLSDVQILGSFSSLRDVRKAAQQYEKLLSGLNYKREFCYFDEEDGIHKGISFTIF